MFARLRGLISRLKGKEEAPKEPEYDVSIHPEDDALQAELQEKKQKVTEWLEPVKTYWTSIEDIMLWKNPLPACICFFVITGVFW